MTTCSTFRPPEASALDDLMRDQLQFLLQIGERPAHEPLDAKNGVFRIGQCPLASGRADENRPVVVKLMTLGTRAMPDSSRTTTGWPSRMQAARLNVVPRSMPITAGDAMLMLSGI